MYFTTPVSVWQHVQLPEQIHPRDAPAMVLGRRSLPQIHQQWCWDADPSHRSTSNGAGTQIPPTDPPALVGCLLACLASQQHASVSLGRICSDKFTCCHTEIEVADQTSHPTQSQYTDARPTSPSADPLTPGAWQGSHWSANFEVTGITRPRKIPSQAGFELRIFCS